MKKKRKTKKVITICITVIMTLGIFIIPSNAATYQPTEDYKITEYTEQTFSNKTERNPILEEITASIDNILLELYNIETIQDGDIFEYGEKRSLLKWEYNGEIYTSNRVKVLYSHLNTRLYYFYAEEMTLYLDGTAAPENYNLSILQNGNETTFSSGKLISTREENIKILIPTSFIEETTKGMTTVLGWVAMPFNALINGGWNSLLVLFAVGIAISGVLIAVKIIRKFIWGD